MQGICEAFSRSVAEEYLDQGKVVVFVGGTGNPFFTTDSAAALRAIEIGADVLLKATKVDGIYDKDPKKHDDAVRFEEISYSEVFERNLRVMDLAAIALSSDNDLPIQVFDFTQSGLFRILTDEELLDIIEKSWQQNLEELSRCCDDLRKRSIQADYVLNQLHQMMRNLIKIKHLGRKDGQDKIPDELLDKAEKLAKTQSQQGLLAAIELIQQGKSNLNRGLDSAWALEMTLLNLGHLGELPTISELMGLMVGSKKKNFRLLIPDSSSSANNQLSFYEIESKWSDYLKSLASSQPGIAGRIRQGRLVKLEGSTLLIQFGKIFSKHKEYLEVEEYISQAESVLENEFDCALKLKFTLQETHSKQIIKNDVSEEIQETFLKYQKDPHVKILQNVFKARIRNVFQEKSEIKYHLGYSSQFSEE